MVTHLMKNYLQKIYLRLRGNDYVYLLSHHVKPNMEYLKEKLINSGVIKAQDEFTIEQLKLMLYEKFKQVDFQVAKDDVIEFINDKRKIEIWSSEFFCDVSEQYLIQQQFLEKYFEQFGVTYN